jgi:hypothetical protein
MVRLVREAKSRFRGRLVRISLERGEYFGAQPYFAIRYHTVGGGIQVARYTPFRERAKELFHLMRQDVIDPERLAAGVASTRGENATRWRASAAG